MFLPHKFPIHVRHTYLFEEPHSLILLNQKKWKFQQMTSRHKAFSYSEAIRQVFAPASKKPLNLLPEDVGLGLYDGPYNRWLETQKKALAEGI